MLDHVMDCARDYGRLAMLAFLGLLLLVTGLRVLWAVAEGFFLMSVSPLTAMFALSGVTWFGALFLLFSYAYLGATYYYWSPISAFLFTPSKCDTPNPADVRSATPPQPAPAVPPPPAESRISSPAALASPPTAPNAPAEEQRAISASGNDGPSFDCAKASTDAEELICNDPMLSKLDRQLAVSYAAARQSAHDPSALQREQQRWMREDRSRCTDVLCMMTVYRSRIEVLSQAGK